MSIRDACHGVAPESKNNPLMEATNFAAEVIILSQSSQVSCAPGLSTANIAWRIADLMMVTVLGRSF